MKQTEKLASAAFLIKRAAEPGISRSEEALAHLVRDVTNTGGGIAGALLGGAATGTAAVKYLPRLFKKLDLKTLVSGGKSKFSMRPYLRKGLYDIGKKDLSALLEIGVTPGLLGGGYLGYKLSDKLQGPAYDQLSEGAANLKSKIPSMDRLKTMIKENPAAIAGGAGVAGLAALLGGGYLAHKALSDKEEEKPEEEDKNKRIN